MADSSVQSDQFSQEREDERLKYLEFVHAAAIHAVFCVARLYGYAKEHAGPLKNGVQTVEGTMKTVVGPVYDKYQAVPLDLLKFVDRKVDESVHELEKHVPPVVKEASSQAYTAAQKAPEVARSITSEVHRAGVVGAATGAAKSAAHGLFVKYEPTAEQCVVSAWRSLNRLPLFPTVAQIVVPTAAQFAETYNRAVTHTAERGFAVSAYLPLVPTEHIAKLFSGEHMPTVAAAK